MKKKTIISKTNESNIPVLLVDSGSYTLGEGFITLPFKEGTAGIFKPFSGIFLLKFDTLPNPPSGGRLNVKIDNIYGEAKYLYKSNGSSYEPLGVGELNVGVYLCYFDTDDRRLYLVQ